MEEGTIVSSKVDFSYRDGSYSSGARFVVFAISEEGCHLVPYSPKQQLNVALDSSDFPLVIPQDRMDEFFEVVGKI